MIAAMNRARRNAPIEALRMCSGLGAVRTVLGYHVDMAETWDWLMAFDRDGELARASGRPRSPHVCRPRRSGSLDVSIVGAEAARRLPEQNRRAASLARSRQRDGAGIPRRPWADRRIRGVHRRRPRGPGDLDLRRLCRLHAVGGRTVGRGDALDRRAATNDQAPTHDLLGRLGRQRLRGSDHGRSRQWRSDRRSQLCVRRRAD